MEHGFGVGGLEVGGGLIAEEFNDLFSIRLSPFLRKLNIRRKRRLKEIICYPEPLRFIVSSILY